MKYLELIGLSVFSAILFVSLMLIYNTMRIVIFSYKEEIQVMKLMGASNFYVRGPYLIDGILYGLISGILAAILMWLIIHFTQDVLLQLFTLNLSDFYMTHILEIIPGFIAGGIIISFISTYFAISKYLKVKEKD